MKILFINGPNLNLLGIRERELYGAKSYDDLVDYIQKTCERLKIAAEIFQSNHEGAIVDKIQSAHCLFDGIVINPAAYTHTSVAILDALKAVMIPTVEVHLTDVKNREPFRQISYAGQACLTTYAGFGFEGYEKAALFLKDHLASQA